VRFSAKTRKTNLPIGSEK